MPKRFTDTKKWDRPWFRDLPMKYKLLWLYVCDACDAGGVWYVDLKKASFQIGGEFEKRECERMLNKQIRPLENGKKWFLFSFVEFHEGRPIERLNPKSSYHRNRMLALYDSRLLPRVLARALGRELDRTLGRKLDTSLYTPLAIDRALATDKDTDKDKDSDIASQGVSKLLGVE